MTVRFRKMNQDKFKALFLELEKTKSDLSALFRSDAKDGWIATQRYFNRKRAWNEFAKTPKGKKAALPKDEYTIVSKLGDLADIYNADLTSWMFERYNTLKKQEATLQEQLRELADDTPIEQGDNWLFFASTHTSTYNSQGWGADRYAANAAQNYADQAEYHHIPVKIECERYDYGGAKYSVYVRVASTLDTEVLRRKSGPGLVEWVQLCWKRGVNPRVYNPFLPHGFEEKHGIKYV